MVVETKFVTIDRDELRELREESAELARLRAAQPASQVGGGELGAYISYVKLHTDWLIGTSNESGWTFIDSDTEQGWRIWQARAALAQAAVDEIARVKNAAREIRDHLKKEVARLESDLEHARNKVLVVMPEKKESRQFDPAGWNAALDEVARLNRRAIPVGLLEKLAHCTEPDCCIAHARGELRALIGKDGE